MQTEKNIFAYLALLVVCIVWGTTYFALRVGVETFPPFLFSAIRQVLAGGILLIVLKFSGKLKINRNQLFTQFILGILMITFGNGVVGWSERYIPSGLAALIVSILPVYIVAINYLTGIDKKKPNKYIVSGLILGSTGIVLIFKDNLNDFANPNYIIGMLVAFGACLSWALGSVYTKHKVPKGNVMTNVAFQMFLGGIILIVMSLLMDDYAELKTINTKSIWALGYLVVIGSVLAYPCYVYALEKLPIGVVSLYAYINPFIALVLGYVLLDEVVTGVTILAFVCVLGAIYFINKGYRNKEVELRLYSFKE
ncbi:EamA family transporter [Sphingobacterium alkalisoli]|uniref:EamA family transporter n=1 Tax=Sphingobacterium alkalisoli TaxID=1874115 RepID=A0A4U0H4Y4_9SPHI|nr:EamA family transporter [Sphingobacterium alkalisoli]TJY66636.1 EamA family transporter [Sphingobacterium alkalisoli]GGH15168.1 drug/metabolite exporter YedA [Sphingobacterium alkalisoli]